MPAVHHAVIAKPHMQTTILIDTAAVQKAHAALRRKYVIQMWIGDVLARLTGRIHNRAFLEIQLTPEATDAPD